MYRYTLICTTGDVQGNIDYATYEEAAEAALDFADEARAEGLTPITYTVTEE